MFVLLSNVCFSLPAWCIVFCHVLRNQTCLFFSALRLACLPSVSRGFFVVCTVHCFYHVFRHQESFRKEISYTRFISSADAPRMRIHFYFNECISPCLSQIVYRMAAVIYSGYGKSRITVLFVWRIGMYCQGIGTLRSNCPSLTHGLQRHIATYERDRTFICNDMVAT